MLSRFAGRLSYANVVATLALFVALGGGAYAAVELGKNDVRSKHIENGQVKGKDLAEDAVTSPKVANGSLLGEDFAAGQLPRGEQGPPGAPGDDGSPDSPQQVLDKLKQVDGAGSGLDADTVAGMPASAIGTLGRSAFANCADDTHLPGGADCGQVTLTLPRPGRVLFFASGDTYAQFLDDFTGTGSEDDDPALTRGHCGMYEGSSLLARIVGTSSHHDSEQRPFSVSGVTGSLGAGLHTFTLRCSELDGDVDFEGITVSAVMIGNG